VIESKPYYYHRWLKNHVLSFLFFCFCFCFVGSHCYIRAISDRAVESTISKKEEEGEQPPKDWKIKMLYDGDCPLCMREVHLCFNNN